jgi:hypothetical protein
MPSRNVSVTAGCLICQEPLPPGRARTTCSDRCRQTLWRRRHQPTPIPAPLPPARQRKATTIYECEDCATRLRGEQRCECGKFMRRIGPGGLCPHCFEPISLEELLDS